MIVLLKYAGLQLGKGQANTLVSLTNGGAFINFVSLSIPSPQGCIRTPPLINFWRIVQLHNIAFFLNFDISPYSFLI